MERIVSFFLDSKDKVSYSLGVLSERSLPDMRQPDNTKKER